MTTKKAKISWTQRWKGETKSLKEWAEDPRTPEGLKETTIYHRLRRGWTVHQALTKPLVTNHGGRKAQDPKMKIFCRGETKTAQGWVESGRVPESVDAKLILSRIKSGWTNADALFTIRGQPRSPTYVLPPEQEESTRKLQANPKRAKKQRKWKLTPKVPELATSPQQFPQQVDGRWVHSVVRNMARTDHALSDLSKSLVRLGYHVDEMFTPKGVALVVTEISKPPTP